MLTSGALRSGYFQYFDFGLGPWADRTLLRIRERVYRIFLNAFSPSERDTILDIGVSENDHVSANYLEKVYPYPQSITALGAYHWPSLQRQFPAITLLCGDGRALPFADNSIDLIYSHAVIEHVGSRENQTRFLAEAFRVCKRGLVVTTPNRWHPVETHTGLPLLHYLPPTIFRRLCAVFGKEMYASEETLNLLSYRNLIDIIGPLNLRAEQIEVRNIRWLGAVSNLVLLVTKRTNTLADDSFKTCR